MTVEVALLAASYCFFSVTAASFWPHLDMRPLVLSITADFHLPSKARELKRRVGGGLFKGRQ